MCFAEATRVSSAFLGMLMEPMGGEQGDPQNALCGLLQIPHVVPSRDTWPAEQQVSRYVDAQNNRPKIGEQESLSFSLERAERLAMCE
jgi:hypothetical protein